MIIETLLYFQYHNGPTNYFVKATEYTLTNGHIVYRLTTIDGEVVIRSSPLNRADAVKQAETRIAAFVARMYITYIDS